MTSSLSYLERLIGFPTVSRDSNLDLIAFVRAELAGLGIDSQIVPDETGKKANLYATIGPADRPGIMLSGHTDVVPVEGQAWSSDAFSLRRDAGRLYGRGSADMKGFIACCLAMAHDAVRRPLATPIHFAFSYDEEIGCVGVRRLIDLLEKAPVRPRLAIIGEPTRMAVVTAHKGKASMRVTCTGLEAHSSLAPEGVNAIHLACDLIAAIRALQAEIAAGGERDGDYDIAYTTLHVGRMRGGETLNIVPNEAHFDFEIRHLPGDDPQSLIARIEAAAQAIVAEARQRFAGAAIAFRRSMPIPPSIPRPTARLSPSSRRSPAAMPPPRSVSAPKAACSRPVSAFRRWCAGRGPSASPTSPTNMSRKASWRPAINSFTGWSTGWRCKSGHLTLRYPVLACAP